MTGKVDWKGGAIVCAVFFGIVPLCSMIANGGTLALLLMAGLAIGAGYAVRFIVNRY